MGRTNGNIRYSSKGIDLVQPEFYLWANLKNTVDEESVLSKVSCCLMCANSHNATLEFDRFQAWSRIMPQYQKRKISNSILIMPNRFTVNYRNISNIPLTMFNLTE
jgi:hypothetical protein